MLSARAIGGFEAQPDAAGRAAYLQQFQQDWLNGEGAGAELDAAAYDRINGELVRRVQKDEQEAARRTAKADKAIEAQMSFLKKGWPVPEAERARLAAAAADIPELGPGIAFLDRMASWQKAYVAVRPEVLDAQIAAQRARMGDEGVTEDSAATLDVMEGLREQMTKGLAEDPLSWAQRAGVAEIEPLSIATLSIGNAATLSAQLAARTGDAEAVARHYGIQPRYFMKAEIDALEKRLRAEPLAMPSLVSGLAAGLGDATPAAMAEISNQAPVLAHVAGLVHSTGSDRIAVEVAEGLNLRAQPGYKSALPPAAKLDDAAREALGAALGTDASAFAEVTDTAAVVFERRALARGLDLSQFERDGHPAREAYLQTLDEVLGATWRDGVKFGGTATVNGWTTIAPPDVEAGAMEGMLGALSGDDLLFQPSIGTANGIPIALWQLRTGRLARASNGRYRIALGDIEAGDPRWVLSTNGGAFELDMSMLRRSQERRDALIEARSPGFDESASARRRRTIKEAQWP